jgi:inositol transport system ATP-binding protein
VAENIFMPFDVPGARSFLYDRRRAEREARPFMDELKMECAPGDIVRNISVAERQLLQVARALANKDFKILILDEPTASLTKSEIDRLFAVLADLKRQNKSIVFITHRLDEVLHLNDFVTVLRNGRVVGHSAGETVDQAWIVQNMTGKDIDLESTFRPSKPPGEVLLEVEGLAGTRFEDISFRVHAGEIVGFAGLVGAGRSEIMQTIFGTLPRKAGRARYLGEDWVFGDPSRSTRRGLLYLSEERKSHGIFPHLTVRQNVGVGLLRMLSSAGVLDEGRERATTQRIIDAYNVRTPSSEAKIVNLSGGNQQKVLIGRSLEANPRVLFLDEPTRGIDINAKDEIYLLMQRVAEENRIGIVLISSELEELLKCCNRVITIYSGRINSEIDESRLTMEALLSAVIGVEQSAARAPGRTRAVQEGRSGRG